MADSFGGILPEHSSTLDPESRHAFIAALSSPAQPADFIQTGSQLFAWSGVTTKNDTRDTTDICLSLGRPDIDSLDLPERTTRAPDPRSDVSMQANQCFSLALWQAEQQTLILARDFPGHRPLYYTVQPGLFAFATRSSALLPLLDTVRIRTERVLDFLVDQSEAYQIEDTCYHNIQRLLPGQTLIYRNGELRVARPDRQFSDSGMVSDPDELRARLSQACCIPEQSSTPDALLVSGGIDSSVLLAQLTNSDQVITAISATTDDGKDPESRHIQLLRKHFPAVEFRHITPAEQAIATDSIADIAAQLTDPFDINFLAMIDPLHALAARSGTRHVFNGIDGDIALGFVDVAATWNLLCRGKLLSAWQAMRKNNTNSAHTLAGTVFRSIFYPLLHRLRNRPGQRIASLESIKTRLAESVLNPELLTDCRMAERVLDTLPRLHHYAHTDNHLALIRHPYLSVALERYWRSADRYGLASCSPYATMDFLEYCAKLPPAAKIGVLGSKQLLRSNWASCLPGEIVRRPRDGTDHLNGRFVQALANHHREELKEAISSNKYLLEPFFKPDYLGSLLNSKADEQTIARPGELYTVGTLAIWLQSQSALLQ